MPPTRSPAPTEIGGSPPTPPTPAKPDRGRRGKCPTDNRLSPVTPESGTPLYLTVRNAIRRAIDEGRFQAGDRIPSTQELSQQLNVSLVTAHRALQELVASGVLSRTQGRGTFVNRLEGAGGGVRARSRVGLVLHRDSSIADYYHGRIFEGVRQAAHDLYVDLVLLRFGEDLRRECDGLLCVNPLPEEVEGIVAKASKEQPVVVVGASIEPGRVGADVTCVDTDNFDIARQAVYHLWRQGHRRIGLVGGTSAISNSRDRTRGYMAAIAEASLVFDPHHDVQQASGWRLDDKGRAKLVALLREPERPTAIFAAGYYFALDVYAAAAEAGLCIGKDLSIVGVDDPPSAAYLSPSLTTLRQPLQRMGVTAVDLLLKAIAGEHTGDQTLKAELIVRESVTKPKPVPGNR